MTIAHMDQSAVTIKLQVELGGNPSSYGVYLIISTIENTFMEIRKLN